MVARELNIKTFYPYNEPDMPTDSKVEKRDNSETTIIRLGDVIISNSKKEIINFYAPDLKFFLFPIAWDESGSHVQCHPQQNLETLADLGNIVLGSNNKRELSDKNRIIFSSKNVYGQIGIMLMGIVFDKKATLNKYLMSDIRKEIRKSQLNKLVRSKANFEDIDNSIVNLFKQLTMKIENINKIYCLANYKSHDIIKSCSPLYDPIILVNDSNIELKSIINMNDAVTTTQIHEGDLSFDVIPDMNDTVNRSSERGIFEKSYKPEQSVELLSSYSGRINSLLVTVPSPYMEESRVPYTLFIDIIKELAEKFPGRHLTLLTETLEESPNKDESSKISTLKKDTVGAELLVLTTTKADDSFSLWAQDAFLTAQTHDTQAPIIVAPEEHQRNNRRNDGSIAEEVVALHPAGYTSIDFPMPIEGGNVLVADDFILIGRDEVVHSGYSEEQFIEKFTALFGEKKPVILVSAEKKPYKEVEDFWERSMVIVEEGKKQHQHRMYRWRGIEQPIFHIDVFMTLLGRNETDKQLLLIGEPVAGFDTTLPLTYYISHQISWYWASYNNCMVEITEDGKKTAWLPSYYNASHSKNTHWDYLEEYDKQNVEIFRENGFTTYLFKNDFHFLASRNGSLHCMTKCLDRSNLLRKSQTTTMSKFTQHNNDGIYTLQIKQGDKTTKVPIQYQNPEANGVTLKISDNNNELTIKEGKILQNPVLSVKALLESDGKSIVKLEIYDDSTLSLFIDDDYREPLIKGGELKFNLKGTSVSLHVVKAGGEDGLSYLVVNSLPG